MYAYIYMKKKMQTFETDVHGEVSVAIHHFGMARIAVFNLAD